MKVVAPQEDLQFLAQILQEQLQAEIPSGNFLRVKCALKSQNASGLQGDRLLILVQHPESVVVDPDTIFAVVEEALSSLESYQKQQVEIFLRVAGVKLPYAKSSLTWSNLEAQQYQQVKPQSTVVAQAEVVEIVEEKQQEKESSSFQNQQQCFVCDRGVEQPQQKQWELIETQSDRTRERQKRQIQTVGVGICAVAVVLLWGGIYFLTRPCVISECKELEMAQNFQNSFAHLLRTANSEQQLASIQQQLLTASAKLQKIPAWSPRFPQAQMLATKFSQQSEAIQRVIKSFAAGTLGMQKSQTPRQSIEELKARQLKLRQAIAPLEAIKPNSELYHFVQPKLTLYRTKLQALNQQLLLEEKWLRQIQVATDTATAASKRQATAKSIAELQKIQHDWQMAVNILISIPESSCGYPRAQKLLAEYKPKLTAARARAAKQLLAAKTYQQAVNVAQQALQSEKQNRFWAAVSYWKQAISIAKQVDKDSLYYTQAQSLISTYSNFLVGAQEKLQAANFLQQIRGELEKICFGSVRVCDFSITDREILVRMTSEYEQVLNLSWSQGEQNDVTNHLQSLQQALEAVSDRAKLAVIVFDAQGNQIHAHLPNSS